MSHFYSEWFDCEDEHLSATPIRLSDISMGFYLIETQRSLFLSICNVPGT